jgi:hypothetical protein
MSKKIGNLLIKESLGFGASCKVKLGIDTETNHKVAIKLMDKYFDKADV